MSFFAHPTCHAIMDPAASYPLYPRCRQSSPTPIATSSYLKTLGVRHPPAIFLLNFVSLTLSHRKNSSNHLALASNTSSHNITSQFFFCYY
ncbi:hypothetical protein RJT34_09813 [Clitoria ternatea]|uniref:Uncharacterized protein n=1 Tax=Clitoria ternatea TaxID=43366 RepID=A0AAN9K7W2_CLITE